MRLIPFLFLLILPLSFAQDAALSVILNETVIPHVNYTKLFKVSNKHPSLGALQNLTVIYSLRHEGIRLFQRSFMKSINRYSTVNTGFLSVDEPGRYTICGKILLEDENKENNEACKIIYALQGRKSSEEGTSQQHLNPFSLTLTQVENGTIVLHLNATTNATVSLTRGKRTVYTSFVSPGETFLSYIPETGGLYTLTARAGKEKKAYSIFLSAPLHKKQPVPITASAVNKQQHKQQSVPSFVFALLFIPLFFLATYVVLRL